MAKNVRGGVRDREIDVRTVFSIEFQSTSPYLANKKNLSRFRYFFIEKNDFENFGKVNFEKIINLNEKIQVLLYSSVFF